VKGKTRKRNSVFRLLAASVLVGAILLTVRPFEAAPLPRSKPVTFDEAPLLRLARLLPPPAKPVDVGTDAQWRAAEKKLGSPFPEDYKRLTRMYGYLTLNQGELRIRNAFRDGTGAGNLFEWLQVLREREELNKELEFSTLPVWPEKDGLLPIGGTPNSHTLCYRTRGKPADWTIAVLSREDAFEEHPCGLVEFLTRMAKGDLGDSMLLETGFLKPPLTTP